MSLVYGILGNFESKIYKDFGTISSLYVLNCFKYFLTNIMRKNVSNIRQEKLLKELYQVFMC